MSPWKPFFSRTVRVLAGTLLALLSLSWLEPLAAFQEKPPLKLVVEGPELENCIVSVRYFRNRQLNKTVVTRVTLVDGRAEENIESQHDGIEIYLQSAAVSMKAGIFADGKALDQGDTDRLGNAKLSVGRVGRTPFQPVDIDLSKREVSVVESLAKAMAEDSSVAALVSESDATEVDGPCLGVLLRELKSLIGIPEDLKSVSQGWLAYGNPDSGRHLAGRIQGAQGVCGFRISLEKNKIVNLVPNCPSLPDNYFQEPIDVRSYVRQARLLTQSLFAGDAKRAHELYSAKFRSQVSEEQLEQLSEIVHQRFGKKIQSIEFKRSQLQAYNFQQQTNLLNVDLQLETDTGARCISRTAFSIPSGRNLVGKAHLGAINVFQVFPSSHPQLAETTEGLLSQLAQGMQAKDVVALYPSELSEIANTKEIQLLLDRIAANLEGTHRQVDFDLWTVSATEQVVTASGPVQFDSNDYFVEVQYTNASQLLGFSLYGPSLSESTFGMFDFEPKVQQAAEQFWTLLLKEDAEAAYAMLHPEFQKQFPLEELKAQLESPQAESAPFKGIVTEHLRLSTSPMRPIPLMVTSYLSATFEEGAPLELTCELGMQLSGTESSGVIYDFSNEFEEDFPVAKIPLVQPDKEGLHALTAAFVANNSAELLALINPESRASIDGFALEAYMKQLKEICGDITAHPSAARTVEYTASGKRYRCNTMLVCASGDSLPLEAWFYQGCLERFSIQDSRLVEFVAHLEDKSEVEKRVLAFVNNWMNASPDMYAYLLPSINTPAMQQSLDSLRSMCQAEHGPFEKAEISVRHPYEGGAALQFGVTLTGKKGTKEVAISVEVGAFGGLISGINF
jgi:hypothetical protein